MNADRGSVQFQKKVYSLEAVKKALYRLSGRAIFELRDTADEWEVEFFPRDGWSRSDVEESLNASVLDEDLREIVRRETETIRNLLLAHAFSRADLGESEGEDR